MKKLLLKLRCRWEDNIKIDCEVRGYKDVTFHKNRELPEQLSLDCLQKRYAIFAHQIKFILYLHYFSAC
jgi:hypothetical protein